VGFVVPLILVITVNLVLQWFTVYGWTATPWQQPPFTTSSLFGMWSLALLPTLVGAAAMLPFYPVGQPWALRIVMSAAFSIMAGALRFGLVYVIWGPAIILGPWLLEAIMSLVVPFSCITVSMYLAKSQVNSVLAERRLTEFEFSSSQAALERENAELRVRRELSSVLHDHVQQRLVYAASRLQSEVVPLATENNDELAIRLLGEIIADIDRLREDDVRQLSHSLFPLGADLGLHQAVALVLGRVPRSVKVNFVTSERAAGFDTVLDPEWDIGHRAAMAEILDESITNALKHGQADTLWVDLDVVGTDAERTVVLTVANNGAPLRSDAVLSGLVQHRVRAQIRGGGLNLDLDPAGHTRLTAWLPAKPVATTSTNVPAAPAAPAMPPSVAAPQRAPEAPQAASAPTAADDAAAPPTSAGAAAPPAQTDAAAARPAPTDAVGPPDPAAAPGLTPDGEEGSAAADGIGEGHRGEAPTGG
jgi:signal transduction histidine kinase